MSRRCCSWCLFLWLDRQPQAAHLERPVHTIGKSPLAASGEAGRPTSGGPSGVGGAAGGYSLLGAAHAGLAASCFLAPTAIANFFFPGESSAG